MTCAVASVPRASLISIARPFRLERVNSVGRALRASIGWIVARLSARDTASHASSVRQNTTLLAVRARRQGRAYRAPCVHATNTRH